MIDLSSLLSLLPLLLPVPIVFLAGLLRQDRFPVLINEFIAWAVVFLVSLVSIIVGIGGHLTGVPSLDFMTIVAYSGALIHTAPFRPLQEYLQTNLLSLGAGEAQKLEQTTIADVKATLDHLTAFLTSGNAVQQAPAPPQQTQVAQVPFPNQAIPSQPGSTVPWLAAVQPPTQ